MLVVSRKTEEKLFIPSIDAVITVVEAKAGNVRLGITAPREVKFLREEIVPKDQEFGDLLQVKQLVHDLRGRVNIGQAGLALLRRHLEHGSSPEVVLQVLNKVNNGLKIDDLPGLNQHKVNALLVEDDTNERELMATLLRMSGIEVTAVEDGDDALIYLKQHQPPDVILLDFNLPRMNGGDFARAVKDQGVKSKIFMVTGSDAPASVPPVDRWIRKPVDAEGLVREICGMMAS